MSEGWEWHNEPPIEYSNWYETSQASTIESGYYKKYYQKWVFIPSIQDNDPELKADGYTWHQSAPLEYITWLNLEKN